MFTTGKVDGVHMNLMAGARVIVGPPTIVLSCPAGVVRGSNLSCNASPTPAYAAVQNISWAFLDAGGHLIPAPAGTSTSWGGTMVVGGKMRVSATVGGTALSDSANIVVTPRPWGRLAIQVSNIGHDILPPNPTQTSDLANTDIRAPSAFGIQQIPDGPNRGWWYLPSPLSAVPVAHRWSDAWQPTHPWRQSLQGGPHPSGNGNWCGPNDMPQIEQAAREHEGMVSGLPASHLSVLRAYFSSYSATADVDRTSPQAGLEEFLHFGSPAAQADAAVYQLFEARVRFPALTDPRQGHYNPLTQQPGNPGMVPLLVTPCHLF